MPNTPRTRKRNNHSRRLNLSLCFANPMQPFTPKSPPTSPTATSSTADHNHNRPSPPATSSSPINYDRSTSLSPQNPYPSLGLDLATAFASQRFFFTSPGRSNSIVESTATATTDCTTSSSTPSPLQQPDRLKSVTCGSTAAEALLDSSSVAVTKYSPDPYADFRKSMEEMVAARPELMDVAAKWRELHELLLCYLALNPKSTHKFILCAFSDFLLSLISRSYNSPPQDPVPGGGECSS